MSYIKELKTRGMISAGQLTKLERLCDALAYGEKYSMIDSVKVQAFSTCIRAWKKTLREDKTRRQIEQVEEASDQNISMEEITDVVDNQAMWETWRKMSKAVRRGKCLSRCQLKLTTAIMATTVMPKSFQR